MTIRFKVLGGYAVMIAIIAAVGVGSHFIYERIDTAIALIADHTVGERLKTADLRDSRSDVRVARAGVHWHDVSRGCVTRIRHSGRQDRARSVARRARPGDRRENQHLLGTGAG